MVVCRCMCSGGGLGGWGEEGGARRVDGVVLCLLYAMICPRFGVYTVFTIFQRVQFVAVSSFIPDLVNA